MAQSDLLLLNGTIYGNIYDVYTSFASGITNSIEQFDYPGFDWDDDVPFINILGEDVIGEITDSSPIDVVSWPLSGVLSYDALSPWKTCGILLSRI